MFEVKFHHSNVWNHHFLKPSNFVNIRISSNLSSIKALTWVCPTTKNFFSWRVTWMSSSHRPGEGPQRDHRFDRLVSSGVGGLSAGLPTRRSRRMGRCRLVRGRSTKVWAPFGCGSVGMTCFHTGLGVVFLDHASNCKFITLQCHRSDRLGRNLQRSRVTSSPWPLASADLESPDARAQVPNHWWDIWFMAI